MKKTALFMFIILLVLLPLSADAQEGDSATQMIAGYLNYEQSSYINLSVVHDEDILDNVVGSYKGINLDISSGSNPYRYIIAPSSSHEPGLKIGTFKLEATNATNYTYELRIYHSKLSTAGGETAVDYDLVVSYIFSGSSQGYNTTITDYCTGTAVLNATDNKSDERIENKQMISITLSGTTGVVLINDAGLYFRLAEPVTVPGQYSSTVYFVLGTLT